MAATFAAEMGTNQGTSEVSTIGLNTLRTHADFTLPVAIKTVNTAAVSPMASPITIGSNAGSAEFAGSIVLTGALLWQAWKRRVI
ncbi:MAG: hypothetical protein QM754_13645 [Tepidisphaeraceae bacterium]